LLFVFKVDSALLPLRLQFSRVRHTAKSIGMGEHPALRRQFLAPAAPSFQNRIMIWTMSSCLDW
jgi:hypothetical protein